MSSENESVFRRLIDEGSNTVINICRYENGKIAEHWGVAERFGLMGQIGLLRPPSAVAALAKPQE